MKDYLACVVYPFANKARIPDSYARETAVISSVFSYPVAVNYNNPADPDYGRFSVAVQPHMGSLSHPGAYKIAIAKPPPVGTMWSEVDWTDPASYVNNAGGTDPRLDQYYTQVNCPPVGAYLLLQGASNPRPLPLAGSAPYEDTIQVWSHYNMEGVTLLPGSPNGTNYFRISPGQYDLHFDALALNTTFVGAPALSLIDGAAADWIESVPRQTLSPDSRLAVFDVQLTVRRTVTLALTAGLASYVAPAAYSNIAFSMTPTFFTSATDGGTGGGISYTRQTYPSGNYGITNEYRTVGCSALLTYMGTTLNDGGMVTGAYLSAGALEKGYFTKSPTPQIGQLQNWENASKVVDAHTCKAKDGQYVIITAEDSDDNMFRKPDYWSKDDAEAPPALVISGVYTPNAAIGNPNVFKLTVTTVYEVTTSIQLFDQQVLVGSQDCLDTCNRILSTQPHAMPNASHMSWIKDFLGGVKQGLGYVAAPAKWLFNNRNDVAGTLAGLM